MEHASGAAARACLTAQIRHGPTTGQRQRPPLTVADRVRIEEITDQPTLATGGTGSDDHKSAAELRDAERRLTGTSDRMVRPGRLRVFSRYGRRWRATNQALHKLRGRLSPRIFPPWYRFQWKPRP